MKVCVWKLKHSMRGIPSRLQHQTGIGMTAKLIYTPHQMHTKELTKKGLIAKKETLINGVKFNTYRATVRNCPVVKKLPLSDVWK